MSKEQTVIQPQHIKEKIKEVTQKYLEWCKSFCITPVKDYEKQIKNEYTEKSKLKIPPEKLEALQKYKQVCEELNQPYREKVEKKALCRIWDEVYNVIDKAVKTEFDSELKKIKDPVLRKKINSAITELYDQKNYVIKEETNELFACKNDNNMIIRAFKKLGGKGILPQLSSITDDEIYEEEVIDDEEDYE